VKHGYANAERQAVTEGRARRVLIAEDEALIRLDLSEMLREEGYEVVGEAGDGESAVNLAVELKPDLCIFDIKMPIMDGIAAAENALSRFAEMQALEAEVASLSERLETRKLVERAKGMLMTAFGMTEPDAFKWIQRAAMDNRMTMKQVAEKIISENLPAGGAAEAATTT